jgi:hypothetical protein
MSQTSLRDSDSETDDHSSDSDYVVDDDDVIEDDEAEADDETVAEDEEEPYILRAKWCMDGSKSLDECVSKLEEFIAYIKELKEEGFELREELDDDYGFLYKK